MCFNREVCLYARSSTQACVASFASIIAWMHILDYAGYSCRKGECIILQHCTNYLKGYKGLPRMLDADAAALLIALTGTMLETSCSCLPSDTVKKGTSLPGECLQQCYR